MFDDKRPILFDVNVIIFEKQNCPCIKLERQTNNIEIMKIIISAAMNNRPVLIQPNFSDKFRSISSLIDKGIIYRKEDTYYFNI
jgi:hypothetical protein